MNQKKTVDERMRRCVILMTRAEWESARQMATERTGGNASELFRRLLKRAAGADAGANNGGDV